MIQHHLNWVVQMANPSRLCEVFQVCELLGRPASSRNQRLLHTYQLRCTDSGVPGRGQGRWDGGICLDYRRTCWYGLSCRHSNSSVFGFEVGCLRKNKTLWSARKSGSGFGVTAPHDRNNVLPVQRYSLQLMGVDLAQQQLHCELP